MDPPSAKLTSLGGAVEAVVSAGGLPRAAMVARVRADEAPALLHLLSSLELSSGWALENKLPLKRAAIAVDLLTIVASALLPVLAEDPADKHALDELRRYAFRIKDCAQMAGGTFRTEACRVAGLLLNLRNRARQLVPPPALQDNIKAIRSAIAQLKSSRLTLLEVNDDDGEKVEVEVDIEEEEDDDDVGARPPRHGSGRKRGLQVAAPTIRATSLKLAMEAAVEAAGSPREVLVAAVHLRHSTALQELLRYEHLRNGWNVLYGDRVEALASADNLLLIISAGVLPGLASDPTSNPLLRLLQTFAGQVRQLAQVVGGSVESELTGMVALLLDLVHDARLLVVTRSWLQRSARTLIGKITTLRTCQVTLSEDA